LAHICDSPNFFAYEDKFGLSFHTIAQEFGVHKFGAIIKLLSYRVKTKARFVTINGN
jgi:hypothetical protein